MNPFFHTDFSISDSLKSVWESVLIYETIIELRRAHTANDKAVMAAYGFSTKMTEADCVGELMKLYQKMQ